MHADAGPNTELQVTAIFLGESFEYTLSAGMQEVLTDPPMTGI